MKRGDLSVDNEPLDGKKPEAASVVGLKLVRGSGRPRGEKCTFLRDGSGADTGPPRTAISWCKGPFGGGQSMRGRRDKPRLLRQAYLGTARIEQEAGEGARPLGRAIFRVEAAWALFEIGQICSAHDYRGFVVVVDSITEF